MEKPEELKKKLAELKRVHSKKSQRLNELTSEVKALEKEISSVDFKIKKLK